MNASLGSRVTNRRKTMAGSAATGFAVLGLAATAGYSYSLSVRFSHERAERAAFAMSRAIAFLQQEQRPSGKIPQQCCSDRRLSQGCHEDETVWSTAFALRSLARVQNPQLEILKQKAGAFLSAERTPEGFWKYWTHDFPERTGMDVVPDVDNTVIAAESLAATGRPVAGLTARLLQFADSEGHLPLWLYPSTATLAGQRENDCVSDANALAYFARDHVQPPAVCAVLNRIVQKGLDASCSTYYTQPEMLAYTVARALEAGGECLRPSSSRIQAWLLQHQRADGSWGGVMETALTANALLALRRRGRAVDRAIRFLIARQMPDGSWPAEPYYLMNTEGKSMNRTPVIMLKTGQILPGYRVAPFDLPFYFASRAVTTALVVEALDRYAGLVR